MKSAHLIALSMTALLTSSALADTGDILDGINMFTPCEDTPAYKTAANEKYGTQWAADVAYGYWNTHRAADGVPGHHRNMALLHAQLNQRLIADEVNGGTWLRAEVSGSWGLDKRTASNDSDLNGSYGSATDVHGDFFGPHHGGVPELALMQYLKGKRLCVIGGMVNLTNYFDAVSMANDSFSGFANTAFMNSTVLPLVDSNLGAVIQYELNDKNYVMAAASRTGNDFTATSPDPFKSANKDGFTLVGEYGHIFGEGEGVLRLNPFYQRFDSKCFDGHNHHTAGLAGSLEWTFNDSVSAFARAGFAAKQQYGTAAELTAGVNLHLLPSRADDFLGLAAGVIKGQSPYGAWDEETEEPIGGQNHRREYVVEAMYSFQVNDYLKIVPHAEYISRPAYSALSDEALFGVQTVFSF